MGEWICEEVHGISIDGKVLSTFLHKTKELVRCKDCKHYEYAIGCVKWHDVCTGGDDWFCADGEMKE